MFDVGFYGGGRVVFWLLQGQRDRSADELEGLPLSAGRLGEHRDGDLGSGVPDLVAGQGGEVLQQAAEAAVGLPGRVVLAGGLGLGGRGAAAWGDGAGRGGRVLVGEGQRGPGPAQVPGQVAGEHADQHVGPDAFLEPVEDGPQVQVVGFDVPEVPFRVFEVLVGSDHGGRVEFGGGDGGAQHVELVQGGLGVDLVLLAGHGEAVLGDGDGEVLAGLVPADHLADLDPDRPGAGEFPGLDAGDDGGQEFLGGGQQFAAGTGAVGG